MANTSNLFITYNPSEDIEQNTALRMQTIAHLYALSLELPARLGGTAKTITLETQQRINRASVVVAISLHKMSKTLQQELAYAMKQNKPIVVLYDKKKGKTIDFQGYTNHKEIHIDFNRTDQSLHEVASFLDNIVRPQSQTQAITTPTEFPDTTFVLGVLGMGLALLALWAASSKK